MDVQSCLIFVNFGRRSKDVEGKFARHAGVITATWTKLVLKSVEKFKSGEVSLLVSDLAARGLGYTKLRLRHQSRITNRRSPLRSPRRSHWTHGYQAWSFHLRTEGKLGRGQVAQKLGNEIVGRPERGRMNVKTTSNVLMICITVRNEYYNDYSNPPRVMFFVCVCVFHARFDGRLEINFGVDRSFILFHFPNSPSST